MKTYICEICGEAYLGEEKPSSCPFCGARKAFIKDGNLAKPVIAVKAEISDVTRKNLEQTLELELRATAIYSCMAGKSVKSDISRMYERLSKVELEHVKSCCKLLDISFPDIKIQACHESDLENFKETLALEDTATHLYGEFAKSSTETHVKIFFTGLMQAEQDHVDLIKPYIS